MTDLANYCYAQHTFTDLARFLRDGIDPDTRQPREHAVLCQACRAETLNVSARCDRHPA